MPGSNRRVFNCAARRLRGKGYIVFNPVESDSQVVTGRWSDYLRKDIKILADAHAIALLPGWSNSKGSCLEVYIALQLGMAVHMIRNNKLFPIIRQSE